MAHFAQVDDNGYVQQVIKISNDVAPDPSPEYSESMGQAYISAPPPEGLGLPGRWLQTSFNNNFRRRYAFIGGRYDEAADVFLEPQPFPSWELDSNYDWQPPTPMPSSGVWVWDEATLSWVEPSALNPLP